SSDLVRETVSWHRSAPEYCRSALRISALSPDASGETPPATSPADPSDCAPPYRPAASSHPAPSNPRSAQLPEAIHFPTHQSPPPPRTSPPTPAILQSKPPPIPLVRQPAGSPAAAPPCRSLCSPDRAAAPASPSAKQSAVRSPCCSATRAPSEKCPT